MKKSILTFIILHTILSTDLSSQTTWSKHYDLDIGNDYATHVIPVYDGIIIEVKGGCDFNSRNCHALVKLDLNGSLDWKMILYDTIRTNGLEAFVIRDDTILLNLNNMPLTNEKAFTVFSYDLNGNYISRFDYSQTKPYAARNMLLRPDGNVYVLFDIKDSITNKIIEYTRCYDRNWNFLWDMHTPVNVGLNQTKSAVSLDSGLIIGYTAWPGGGQDLAFNVEKYSKDGQLEWHTKYPHSCDNNGSGIKINAMPDGTYIGAFKSDSFGFLIAGHLELWFKLNANGDRVWEKANTMEERSIYHSFVSQSGNIIACGEMDDYYFDTIQDPYLSGYLMCLNPDGERVWERKILDKTAGIYRQYVYGGTELPNGDLVFVGMVWDTMTTPENPAFTDMWIFKTDSLGCLTPGCGEWQSLVAVGEPQKTMPVRTFGIYPNPVTDHCNLVATLGEVIPTGQYFVRLYDSKGQFLFSQNIDPLFLNQIDLSGAPAGLCTAVLFREGAVYQTIKVVKGAKEE
jgi:hypothetical protein